MSNRHTLKQQIDDATFLEQRFGMTPRRASELVARDGVEPDTLREQTEKHTTTPELAGSPVPQSPASDLTTDTDEQLLKPVLDTKNNRVGGG